MAPGRFAVAALVALSVVAACTSPAPKTAPSADVVHAEKLAREAGAVLLRLSAYDYALAGTFEGQKTHVVSRDRYATVAREAARAIGQFTDSAVKATVDAGGPVRDRVVVLADGLIDLAREANAYADGGDPAAFARVVDRVRVGWGDLRALVEAVAIEDDEMRATLTRGGSFVVNARALPAFAVTVGPFATAAEAEAAARRIGSVESVTRVAPFLVRVGTYPDRPSADAASLAVSSKALAPHTSEEQRHAFARSGPAPDLELWREPERIFDTWGSARRLAVSPNAAWVATGSDDGTLAVFSGDGVLRSLPKFNAGVAHLVFSDDGRWLMGGGLTLVNFILPPGVGVGTRVVLATPATDVLFIPGAYAFAAAAKSADGSPGVVAGRAPDGVPLAAPFPMAVAASGAALAASATGELYIAQTIRAPSGVPSVPGAPTPGATTPGTEVQVLRVGRERSPRGVVRVPGEVRGLAVDRGGTIAAIATDQGVFRVAVKVPDPTATVKRLSDAVRDLAFGPDGTLYLLEPNRVASFDLEGTKRWSSPLVDGRRLVAASRPVVLDGIDRLITFDAQGRPEELGAGGQVQDVSASPDGKRVGALVDGRKAVLFKLP